MGAGWWSWSKTTSGKYSGRIGWYGPHRFHRNLDLQRLDITAQPRLEGISDIHLDLFEMVTREQISKLIDGELDLGLARQPFDRTNFSSRLLYREELLLAVPSEGLPAQPIELHLLWGRETRNPALHTVLDCLRHASL